MQRARDAGRALFPGRLDPKMKTPPPVKSNACKDRPRTKTVKISLFLYWPIAGGSPQRSFVLEFRPVMAVDLVGPVAHDQLGVLVPRRPRAPPCKASVETARRPAKKGGG